MRTLVMKIRGGLGNQLFQYAFARKMMEEFSFEQLILDVSYYSKKRIRNIEINKYVLKDNIKISYKRNYCFDLIYFVYRIVNSILRKINGKELKLEISIFNTLFVMSGREISEISIKNTINKVMLSGYFQNEAEIRNISHCLKEELRLSEIMRNHVKEYYNQIIGQKKAVGISIRIGDDYKKLGWPICSRDYYIAGIEHIKKIYNDIALFVFADCINIVKAEGWFAQYDVTYIEECDAVESLFLLKECKHFIISNSTFAWWGAYLSNCDKKKIIAPRFFYSDVKMEKTNLKMQNAIYLDNKTGMLSDCC